ncbi:hypothetical protein DITRI_Ditri03aG0063200 [Diplodiscus trichospermus]
MEDDNGLELSLGLSCGAPSVKSKGKIDSSSDTKTEEGDRGIKLVDDFKNFLQAGNQKQDCSVGSQRSDPVKPSENFFNDLSKAAGDAEASVNLNGRGLWGTNTSRSAEIDEDKRSEAGSKRKMSFDEINNPKKLEREAHHTDLHEKPKTSHISITTDDGSTAENEDVAESEVEGSTSRLVSHHDDGSKRFTGVSGSSELPKEVKLGILNYGNPFPVQSVNAMNVPFSLPMKDSTSVGTPSSSGHTLPGMIQIMPTGNGERSGTQAVNPGNFPVMFGYSPVQLPLLDKDNPWGMVSHPSQFHSSYAGRAPNNLDKHGDGLKISQASMHTTVRNSSEAAQYDGRTFERVKGDGNKHATEEGSSTQAEEDVKGSSINLRANASADQPTESLPLDFSAIKPGIAADLKFGGSGSYPNLPWVSTTGTGPHGRTISGVTYRFSANQIKIVCACHGTHMYPDEFVRHASEECANPDNNNGLATCPSTNPAASAQS